MAALDWTLLSCRGVRASVMLKNLALKRLGNSFHVTAFTP